METAAQPSLFDKPAPPVPLEDVVLYALGEFQARGHRLADRELALDRLHGAFLRAAQKFGIRELSDEYVVKVLSDMGVVVHELPSFVAKRPYRLLFGEELCRRGSETYRASKKS